MAFQGDAFQHDAFQAGPGVELGGGDAIPGPIGLLLKPTGGDVTIALTGVAATGAVGTVGVVHDQALTGNAGTGAVGSVAVAHAQALTGAAGTGAVGTVGVDHVQALTGVAATGAVGSVGAAVALALTGVAGAGAVGTVGVDHVQPLGGVEGVGAVGTVTVAGSPDVTAALSGVAGTGAVGTVGVDHVQPLSGAAGTGAVGTVTAVSGGDVTVALTGVQGTGEVGTVAASGGGPTWGTFPSSWPKRDRSEYFPIPGTNPEWLAKVPAKVARVVENAAKQRSSEEAQALLRKKLDRMGVEWSEYYAMALDVLRALEGERWQAMVELAQLRYALMQPAPEVLPVIDATEQDLQRQRNENARRVLLLMALH